MKHRKESQEYNPHIFNNTDTDHNGYLDWKEYIELVCTYVCAYVHSYYIMCVCVFVMDMYVRTYINLLIDKCAVTAIIIIIRMYHYMIPYRRKTWR